MPNLNALNTYSIQDTSINNYGHPPTLELVEQYKFDGDLNSIQNTLILKSSSTPTFTTGVFDKAISLNNYYLYFDNLNSDFFTQSWTLAFWFKLNELDNTTLIDFNENLVINLSTDENKIEIDHRYNKDYSGIKLTGDIFFNTTDWYCFVLSYDSFNKTYKLLLNNNKITLKTEKLESITTPTQNEYLIGTDNKKTSIMKGLIDQFRMYSTYFDYYDLYQFYRETESKFVKSIQSEDKVSDIPRDSLTIDLSFNSDTNDNLGKVETELIGSSFYYKDHLIDNAIHLSNNTYVNAYKSLYDAGADFSVSFWIKLDNVKDQVIAKSAYLDTTIFEISLINAKLKFTWNGGSYQSDVYLQEETWYHIVFNMGEGKEVKNALFINGEYSASINGDMQYTPRATNFYIGCVDNKLMFNGFLDQFRLYSRPLDLREVRQLYNENNYNKKFFLDFEVIYPEISFPYIFDYKNLDALFHFNNNIDEVFNHHTTEASGIIEYDTGISGNCLKLEGSGFVEVKYLNLSLYDEITISFWANATPDSQMVIIGAPNEDDKEMSIMINENNDIIWYFKNGKDTTTFTMSGAFIPKEWHNYILIATSEYAKLYIDGKLISIFKDYMIKPTSDKIYIGAGYDGKKYNFYKGLIDEVYIFEEELNPAKIENLININKKSLINNECIKNLGLHISIGNLEFESYLFENGNPIDIILT